MAKASARWIVGVCGAAMLAGCGSVRSDYIGPDAAVVAMPDATPGKPPTNPGSPDAGVVVTKWYKLADGIEHEGEVPGFAPEDGDGASVGDDAQARRAGFVHVDWCDKPGKEATVCKWDAPEACTREQAWAECEAESETVCGTIGYPHVLFY